jgi:uncharacterized protein (DUF1501 family)
VATADGRTCGCPDYTLSRRRMLAGMAAGTGALAGASVFGDAYRQVAYGIGDQTNVVVVLSFRGGSDGLSIVVPTGAADQTVLETLRPDLVVRTADVVAGGNGWGLHPALAPLVPMWNAGNFGAVHGVGLPEANRSHFEAMELVEEANPGSSSRVGWINRVVGLDATAYPESQLQFGSSMLPTALNGPTPALGAYGVNDLRLPSLWYDQKLRSSLNKVWGATGTSLSDGVRVALSSVQRLETVAATDMEPIRQSYPDGPLRDVLANTATLIKANVGAKVITIDYGDWDMHTELGRPEPGDANWMWNHLDHFATSLARFFEDLGATWASKVTVVTISEFGRRVEQNGAGTEAGVDHGYGNVMMLLGGGVNGGQVHGSWQGLDNLNDGDVSLAQDYRHVMWNLMKSRFSGPADGALNESKRTTVFPGLLPSPASLDGLMA